MPVLVDSSIKPTVIVQPDMRFATSFLGTKYRDYAVPGEAIMDKVSGELFFKREIDGKVVSFHQNKKMINDLVLELRLLLTNNEAFEYPFNDDNAFYVSTNYDLITINNEKLFNLITDDITVTNTQNDINKLSFKVAGASTGFFCRSTSRDCDKPIIEFLTNQYNLAFENYEGYVQDYVTERDKFVTIDKWKDSNAILTYELVVHKDESSKTYVVSDTIRMNEDVAVIFPDSLYTLFPRGVDYYDVTIKSITFDKLHFMVNHKNEFGDAFLEAFNKIIFADNRIEVNEFNIIHFVNDANDITINGNEAILAFLDIPYINRYMGKMAKLKNASSIITSISEPNDVEWTANTLWAERIRDVGSKGVITENGSKTVLSAMEAYFAPNYYETAIGNIVQGDDYTTDDFPLLISF